MIEELRKKALKLPLKPGVYIMMDASGEVIYVGKAKLLKNRVSSYFHGSHNAKTEAMISKIADFDVMIARTEFEALVLENSLIKHHMPKYNILLKDDKGYPFVRLDIKSQYPKFSIVSKTAEDGAVYFGPFGGRGTTASAIDAVCKAFKLPTCGRKFPRDIGKERPCLNYHMGACSAYCLKDSSQAEYLKAIDEASMVFDGKADRLAAKLKEEMEKAADRMQFERAAELRDRIKAVSNLGAKQHVWSQMSVDTDALGFYRDQARSCFVVLHYIEGRLLDKDFEILDTPLEDDCEAVSSLVSQYYAMRGTMPKYIYLPCEIPDLLPLEQLLSENAGRRVYVSIPKRGDKLELVNAANINAREETERVVTREERISKTAEWLRKALGMDKLPDRIEAFDISNTGSSDIVASMTVFFEGKPLKKAYRKFKIKTTDGQDDYHSMMEALERRFRNYAENNDKFSILPDLLLIDGGQTHASAAKNVVDNAGLAIPVFGMVKDDRHRTRALISPEGREIGISTQPSVFAYIGNIQEETHRFAIEYHRKLHTKNTLASELDEISGVGEKRKNTLLKSFKSMKAIKEASYDQLCTVIPKDAARAVHDHFHAENDGGEE